MSPRPAAGRPPKRPAAEADKWPGVVVTYKRRRVANRTTSSNPGKVQTCTTMGACTRNSRQAGHQKLARHWITWRNTLEGFLKCPRVNRGGGIQSCIQDALRYNHSRSVRQGNLLRSQGASQDHPTRVVDFKVIDTSAVLYQGHPTRVVDFKVIDTSAVLDQGHPTRVVDFKVIDTSVVLDDATAASLDANTTICNNALLDILVSEKFALLCDLLVGTFRVNKVDEFIGLVKIDASMRNGIYAQNPELFHDDIQQLWEKFEQVGREITSLASNLPIISRASYKKQASGVSEVEVAAEHRIEETSLVCAVHKISKDSTTATQFSPCDSGHSTIPKQTELYRICICKHCGSNVEEEKSLICDGCDTMYHFDCVKLTQIPATWHCPACGNKGKKSAAHTKNNVHHNSLHGDCPLCDKLDVVKKIKQPEAASEIELAGEREGSSVPSVEEENEADLSNLCKHCGTCEDDDKKFLVCGHPYCAFKFYHVRCLKTSQIVSGKQKTPECWYCPSCLCRGCFKNKDDEDIVLCDGCDDAYHIYCMTPKRTCVPKGQWYCPSCSIQRAREGLQRYEKSILKKHRNA